MQLRLLELPRAEVEIGPRGLRQLDGEVGVDTGLDDDAGAVRLDKVLLNANNVARSGNEAGSFRQGVEKDLGLRVPPQVHPVVVARVPLFPNLLRPDNAAKQVPWRDIFDDGFAPDDGDRICAACMSMSAALRPSIVTS